MAITINNGVQNILGTPGAISGVFSDRPAAIDIAAGTLYFSTDTAAIYQVVAGSWILYTGGGGGNQNLQQVTDVGNVTTNDIYVNSVYYNDFAAPDQYGRLSINDFGWIFTDIDNVIRCVIQEGAIALRNKVTNYQWRLDSENLTKDFVFQMPNSLSGFIQDIIPISVNGVYADINGDIAISTSGSTGVNGLNGTTNIGLGGTLLNDTTIDADNFSFDITNIKTSILSTLNGNAINIQDGIAGVRTLIDNDEKGLLVFGDRVLLGDFINGSLNFNIETDTGTIFTNYSSQGQNGFILDFANGQYKLGDYQNQVGGSAILIDAPNAIINTVYNGTSKGLRLDFQNDNYFFGDYGITAFGLTIDVTNANANLFCSTIVFLTGNASGFGASGNQSSIGDVDGAGNSTIFGVDDNSETLVATNVITNIVGLPANNYLKIRINGNDYVIPLYNPS